MNDETREFRELVRKSIYEQKPLSYHYKDWRTISKICYTLGITLFIFPSLITLPASPMVALVLFMVMVRSPAIIMMILPFFILGIISARISKLDLESSKKRTLINKALKVLILAVFTLYPFFMIETLKHLQG